MISTADLCDMHSGLLATGELRILHGTWRWFSEARSLCGQIMTLEARGCNAELRDLLAQPGHARVLIIDAGNDSGALLGDNLAKEALRNGWGGVFVNGNVRDCSALASIALPVLAMGSWPQRSKNQRGGGVGAPLTIGGAPISPGDWIYADEDGVVVSKSELKSG
ncbi:ribonuclease E activity regulator RraA [Pantoea sp. Ap-967]|uniref:ribonuclease E activity regulator RraA n=1 Tax=Pantoea sp. Ap-967 TaxID=2608362 RepID=UPI00142202F5|nr:ribonuclease E activity regulator RraA [Pantoea sp. Ap-967]NIE75915.1 ribonuclease E activity regulator RraA [Pantoea sp. Ap-967]